jgi:hypothetical protein
MNICEIIPKIDFLTINRILKVQFSWGNLQKYQGVNTANFVRLILQILFIGNLYCGINISFIGA